MVLLNGKEIDLLSLPTICDKCPNKSECIGTGKCALRDKLKHLPRTRTITMNLDNEHVIPQWLP